ncbi:hypothetical protein [Deinococcus metallilatus]|uniref:Uncharacterized protein n=1 Tax=Deinococcus metallilatus TaxID=1211322 RepID=A0ABR6MVK1_9DEIO|nr:hypothetical protein [Deinococcus metallilatus]MBB5295966.1 hypothetical protein [Deinococcus metallilatus]GMA14499.1 hypothetical protein GCM10025871_08300 [Deinococcus metallilatus]
MPLLYTVVLIAPQLAQSAARLTFALLDGRSLSALDVGPPVLFIVALLMLIFWKPKV